MQDSNAVSVALRAFADANVVHFTALHEHLYLQKSRVSPKSDFHVYRGNEAGSVYVVLGTTAIRPDGTDVVWSVAMTAAAETMEIQCVIEEGLDPEDGYRTLLSKRRVTESSNVAAETIMEFAAEICARWDLFEKK